MPSDELRKSRRKSKLVVELRYEPMPEAFDRRGSALRKLHTQFKSKMKHWSGENVAVRVADDLQNPTRQILVEHRRCAVAYEDFGSLDEFVDDAERALRLIHSMYADLISEIQRLGVRSISVFEREKAASYEDVLEIVKSRYLAATLPLSIGMSDFNVTLRR